MTGAYEPSVGQCLPILYGAVLRSHVLLPVDTTIHRMWKHVLYYPGYKQPFMSNILTNHDHAVYMYILLHFLCTAMHNVYS